MYTKYPRTYHFPWSPGKTSDDKVIKDYSLLEGKEVVMTVKMDGENTTMYPDHIHARSLDSQHHPSRDWVKALWGEVRWDIPEGHRICGENLYAQHSIRYDYLAGYFYMFSMWNGDTCLSWDETVEWGNMLAIPMVHEVWRGTFNEPRIRAIARALEGDTHEGIVVRLASEFKYDEFDRAVAKYVRANHVQTDTHWMHSEIKPNGLA